MSVTVDQQQGISSAERLTPAALLSRYRAVRRQSEILCKPLEVEDYGIQTCKDMSPPKWHLAHTSWFFETFLLKSFVHRYREFHPLFDTLFNSYYDTVGAYHPRPERGLLSRPTVAEVFDYRAHVDEQMIALISDADEERLKEVTPLIEIGLHHEQQHQELLLTDIKHIFAYNPFRPVYHQTKTATASATPLQWIDCDGGLCEIGHDGQGFAYDNETPRHKVYVEPYRLASRPVTNGEFMAFMDDAGYRRPEYWLSDGWKTVKQQGWEAPLYWQRMADQWWHMTLNGMRPVDEHAPLCHVSYYEADAYARWAHKRLPSEAEWELAAAELPVSGHFVNDEVFHPRPASGGDGLQQMFGDVWEWTASPYVPYPGFRALGGSLGEYNGKFMSNQLVLRGGSCVTPADHIRATYRNFFYPGDRWQFMGFRLAEDR